MQSEITEVELDPKILVDGLGLRFRVEDLLHLAGLSQQEPDPEPHPCPQQSVILHFAANGLQTTDCTRNRRGSERDGIREVSEDLYAATLVARSPQVDECLLESVHLWPKLRELVISKRPRPPNLGDPQVVAHSLKD